MNRRLAALWPRLWALVGWRLVILFLPALFAVLPWASFSTASFAANFHEATPGPPTWATRWATWDAQHYLYLAREGYTAGHISSAFWPLWPLLVRLIARGLALSELTSSLLLANLLAIAATAGLWKLVNGRAGERGPRVADRTILLLLSFPSAFFLSLPYSESFFLALVIALFLALENDRLGWASVVAALLPLARPVGLFLLVPLAVWSYGKLRDASATSAASARVPSRRRIVALLAAPILGALLYFVFHFAATGEARGAFAVRGQFVSGQSIARLWDLSSFARSFVAVDSFHSVTGSALDRAIFLLVLASLPWLYRRDRVWFAYTATLGLVPALTLHFMAYSRFALVLFPIFWCAAQALDGRRSRLLRICVPAIAIALQFWLYWRQTLSLWAG